jgi:hypothetical protein
MKVKDTNIRFVCYETVNFTVMSEIEMDRTWIKRHKMQ